MKLTKKIVWPSIFVISLLIWFVVCALFGHFWWHKSYSTEKPTNWDTDTTLINHSELKPLATASE